MVNRVTSMYSVSMRKNVFFLFCRLLVSIWFHQPSFAEEKLIYKAKSFQKFASFMGKGPSVANLAALITFSSGNPDNFQDVLDYAKKANLEPEKTRIYAKVSGNEIRIEGLKDPLIIGNEAKPQVYYRNRKIPWSEGKSLAENLNALDKFFQHSNTTAQSSPFRHGINSLLWQAWLPEAKAINPYLITAGILFAFIVRENVFIPTENIESIVSPAWPFLKGELSAIKALCDEGNLIIESDKSQAIRVSFSGQIVVAEKKGNGFQPLEGSGIKNDFLMKWATSMIGNDG